MKNDWKFECAACEGVTRRISLLYGGQRLRFCSPECLRSWVDAALALKNAA